MAKKAKATSRGLGKCEYPGCDCDKFMGTGYFCTRKTCKHRDIDHKLTRGSPKRIGRYFPADPESGGLMSTTIEIRDTELLIAECATAECCELETVTEKGAAARIGFAYGHWVVRGLSNLVLVTRNYFSVQAQLEKGKQCYGADLIETTYHNGGKAAYQEPYSFCKIGGFYC